MKINLTLKSLLYTAFLLACSLQSIAQAPWSPVHRDKIYTYEKCEPMPYNLGGIDLVGTEWYYQLLSNLELCFHNIKVISDSISNGDSIFVFNRESRFINSQFWDFHHPTFLNATMRVSNNNEYYFQGLDTFLLKPQAGLGEFWTYKDTISATVIDLQADTLWNTPDSVKTILLSNNDTIRLSRNFGILQFPSDNAYNMGYQLAGLQRDTTTWGIRTPDFWDFYNFNIGDVFMYHHHWGNYGISEFHDSYEKVEITEKIVAPYGYIYTYTPLCLGYYVKPFDCNSDTVCFFNIDTLDQIQQPHFYSSHLNYDYTIESDLIQGFNPGPRGWITLTMPGLYFPTHKSFIGIDDNVNDSIFHNYDRVHFDFVPGLGMMHYSLSIFEAFEEITLMGWIKNGDTIGTIYSDSFLIYSSTKPIESQNTQADFATLFPNPAPNGHAQLLFKETLSEGVGLKIYNSTGQRVASRQARGNEPSIELDYPDLPKGLYFIRLNSDGKEQVLKWVIF